VQETNNKRRFILLLVLTVTTLVALWWVQPENRLDVDTELFRIDDLKSISRVELASDTTVVSLTFDGARWRVNEKYHADANMISVLFATLRQAIPKRPVANTRQDSIFRNIEGSGVKVSLFEADILKKQFFAGGNKAKTQAFFADPVTRQVYVMAIPGYRVYVSGIFELGESGWRDKFVFGFNWRNFKSLRTEFLQNHAENFTVSMNRDHFGINGLAKADTSKLNTFLDDVSLLTVDAYLHEPGLIDSLRHTSPQLQLWVTDIGDRTYRLRLFNHKQSPEVMAIFQDSDVVIFDRRKIQPLLKPKSFFKEK
jgi:hypothetical protein